MRVFEDKTETVTRKVLKELRCDICGRAALNGDWGELHNHVDITVKHEEFSGDPLEGGTTTTCDIDICPECFRDKLVPWVRSQGRRSPTYDEVNW